jgi:hypothetical protein
MRGHYLNHSNVNIYLKYKCLQDKYNSMITEGRYPLNSNTSTNGYGHRAIASPPAPINEQTWSSVGVSPSLLAGNRYVYGPYNTVPYPAQQGYPALTWQGGYIPGEPARVVRFLHRLSDEYDPSSLKSVLAHTGTLDNAYTSVDRIGVLGPVSRQPGVLVDNRLKPYFFRHYIPPTYYEQWDYNMDDLRAANYNESLRQKMQNEVWYGRK